MQADTGCDLDFLVGKSGAEIPPRKSLGPVNDPAGRYQFHRLRPEAA